MSRAVELKLLCDLTPEEITLRSQEIAACLGEVEDIKMQKSAAAKEFTRQIAELEERMRKLATAVRSKQESRMVSCVVEFHVPQVRMKRITRTDTGELVREEFMSDEECQQKFFPEEEQPAVPQEAVEGGDES